MTVQAAAPVAAQMAPVNVDGRPVVKYKATEVTCGLIAYGAFLGTSFVSVTGLSAFTFTALGILPPNPGTTVGLVSGLGTGFVAGIKLGVAANNHVDRCLLGFCQSLGI